MRLCHVVLAWPTDIATINRGGYMDTIGQNVTELIQSTPPVRNTCRDICTHVDEEGDDEK